MPDTIIPTIKDISGEAWLAARAHWDSIAHPLHGMGRLEDAIVRIAAIQGTPHPKIDRRALVIMCADNGVVAEGVSQTGQEVTAKVAENFLKKRTPAAVMAQYAGADLFPVDVGMAADTNVERKKTAYGTKNIYREPAMTRGQAIAAIAAGVESVRGLAEMGYGIIATGEMGIGNTTTSSAVVSVLLNKPPQNVAGRGAGLSAAGLKRKIHVISHAIDTHRPDPNDPIDVISKVGGFDIAGLAGVFLGCAAYGVTAILDGFISCTAALCAAGLEKKTLQYCLASHISAEPAGKMLLDSLGLEPFICAGMCLGEGTGAVALIPLLDMALEVYNNGSSFGDIDIEAYGHFD